MSMMNIIIPSIHATNGVFAMTLAIYLRIWPHKGMNSVAFLPLGPTHGHAFFPPDPDWTCGGIGE